MRAGDLLSAELDALKRRLPRWFPDLGRNAPFVALLRGIGPRSTRQALRAQLMTRPFGNEVGAGPAEPDHSSVTFI
jgi:hypothetical protein